MSIIQIGMDANKVEKDITKLYITRLLGEIAELEKERDKQKLKKEHAFKRERYLIAENLELKQKTFAYYNDEEYWIFQDDGEDYAESLVCPVVMSATQFRRLLSVEAKALKEQVK